MRGATVSTTPWARAALPEAVFAQLGETALALGAHLNMVGRGQRGPWVVRAWDRDRVVENRGHDLEALAFEALERFRAGADTRTVEWIAGADALAHGHAGRGPWTLCKAPAVGPQYAHPERSRCRACLRTLDTGIAA